MKVRFITNIPSPYRVDFFNLLGKEVELEVVFEAERLENINEKWYKKNEILNFKTIILKKGEMKKNRLNLKILKYIRNDTDILVLTNYGCLTELFAFFIAKLKGIDYILEIDGAILPNRESFIKKKLKEFIISGATLCFSPSQESDAFLKYYGANEKNIKRYPFTSLHNNDLEDINNLNKKIFIRKQLGIKGKKIILSVGQFIYRKGFDWMIEALSSLNYEYEIYIIGGKVTKEYLDIIKQLDIKNVHFKEFMSKEELKKWYLAADLFVFPTREDIWGLVINEALSNGLPIITTNRCVAGKELIRNYKNGFLVDVEDKETLLNKVNEYFALDENERSNYSKNALNIIKDYTFENMVEKHIEYFNYLIEQKQKQEGNYVNNE